MQRDSVPADTLLVLQGNIAKWYVKTGDEIAAGTVLADIETDKATLAFENQDDGFIAAILKPDGAKDIPVGEPVAIIVEDADDVAAFANYTSSEAASAAPAAAGQPAAAAAAAPQPAAAGAAGGSWPDYTVSERQSTHNTDSCAQTQVLVEHEHAASCYRAPAAAV